MWEKSGDSLLLNISRFLYVARSLLIKVFVIRASMEGYEIWYVPDVKRRISLFGK